jgi:Fe2+ or Zn2+ uptake regulation protein
MVTDERARRIAGRLRDRGGRMTRPRRVVIEALLSGPGHHKTASEIVAAIRADDPGFYESTVYRTLDRLLELGVVERVQLGSGGAVFHLPHRPHHHLVCERCGTVVEIPGDALDDLAARVRSEHGFRLRPSASTLVGTCAPCAAQT